MSPLKERSSRVIARSIRVNPDLLNLRRYPRHKILLNVLIFLKKHTLYVVAVKVAVDGPRAAQRDRRAP